MIPITDIKKGFIWFIIACLFDVSHYHFWEYFRAEDQLFVYDSLEAIKVLFYVYAGVQVFKKCGRVAAIVCKTWMFYVTVDAVAFIYDYERAIISSTLTTELVTFSFFVLITLWSYKDILFWQIHEVVGYHRDSRRL